MLRAMARLVLFSSATLITSSFRAKTDRIRNVYERQRVTLIAARSFSQKRLAFSKSYKVYNGERYTNTPSELSRTGEREACRVAISVSLTDDTRRRRGIVSCLFARPPARYLPIRLPVYLLKWTKEKKKKKKEKTMKLVPL